MMYVDGNRIVLENFSPSTIVELMRVHGIHDVIRDSYLPALRDPTVKHYKYAFIHVTGDGIRVDSHFSVIIDEHSIVDLVNGALGEGKITKEIAEKTASQIKFANSKENKDYFGCIISDILEKSKIYKWALKEKNPTVETPVTTMITSFSGAHDTRETEFAYNFSRNVSISDLVEKIKKMGKIQEVEIENDHAES